MKIGLTYDLRTDYGIDEKSEIFADFCNPNEIGYMQQALEVNGYQVEMIGNMYHLRDSIQNGEFDCDLVLVCDEGISSRNREALVPAILELNHIPYVGSDAYAMGLSQNKYHTKLVAEALEIPVPKGFLIPYPYPEGKRKAFVEKKIEEQGLEFPLIMKPNAEGYSMGVFLVNSVEELLEKLEFDFVHYKQEVLVEIFVEGEELYVPIIGTGEDAYVLNVGVARYENHEPIQIFTLNDKCFRQIIDEIPKLDGAVKQQMFDWALKLYRHMGCVDFGRVDYKLDGKGNPILIEINPRPGLTQDGPYENCGKSIGKDYNTVLGEIIDSARRRYGL